MKNHTIMQYFEWYLQDDGQHWQRLIDDAPHLATIGVTKVWLPPAFKATGTNDVGYGVYDLFDLGEFDQKGTIRTKYGTKDDYIRAIQTLKAHDIMPIADIVLNHKANADYKERFTVMKMDPNNRQVPISEPYEIEGWTHFSFDGRQGKYNDFQWHWYHFNGTDYDALHNETGVYLILGDHKGWANNENVDDENGNYDYLMYSNIDYSHSEVKAHIYEWIQWFVDTTQIGGFRLDAIKHIDRQFMTSLIQFIHEKYGENFYVFGEYWKANAQANEDYLEDIRYTFDLVDVVLHMNFYQASQQGEAYDLRTLFDGTLMKRNPMSAVTFVDNHDTQRGQALESTVEDWFKPLAYASILLREQGLPCVFYGDYYGIEGEFYQASFQEVLDKLLYLRQHYAYGEQVDVFEQSNCIAWSRLGNEQYPEGLVVLLSNGERTSQRVYVGQHRAGDRFVDYLGYCCEDVWIDATGYGEFIVNERSVSAWIVQNNVKENHDDE